MNKSRKKRVAMSIAGLITLIQGSMISFAQKTSGVYDHLMSDTFYYRNGNTKWGERFELWSKAFLEIVLPFMAIFGISNIVLSMSASVIYLSRPDFFDKVHLMKYINKQMRGETGKMHERWRKIAKDLGLSNLMMALFIPDFKALAFYDAAELGEDGRPSVTTFMKTGFPKYAAILALIIMISDGTLMGVNLKAAEVSAWFFGKAKDYNYVGTLERLSQQGAKYKVYYKGGKKKIFETVYNTALSLDDSLVSANQEYREQVGAKVNDWVLRTFSDSDFEGTRVSVGAVANTMSQPADSLKSDGNSRVYEIPVSEFGVTPTGKQNYIVVNVEFSEIKDMMMRRTFTTINPECWTQESETVVSYDITKHPNLKTADPNSIKIVSVSPHVNSTENVTIKPEINGTTVTFTLSSSNYNMFAGEIVYKSSGQSQQMTLQFQYANPNAQQGVKAEESKADPNK